MAARNNAGGKAASITEATGLRLMIIRPVLYLPGERSSNSTAIILPPFRSRPFDRMMKIKKMTLRHV
jgi:hypothetical protein